MELNRRPVAALWIGERLDYINQLCLKSHLRHGHRVILYCTDTVQNPPEGVEIRPATEIMDISSARVKETSASFWSNVFRYKMIKKTGAIWIDCDAFCHRPFPEDQEWIFAGHGMRGALNCGVVGLPQQSELLDVLLDYYDNLPDYPAWWNRKQRSKMDALPADMPHATRIYKAERTAFGPQAFTHYVKATDNLSRAMAPSALYPVPFQLVDVFFDPHGQVEGWMKDDTLSVHLYTNGIKPYWQNNPPLPNSYVARMCEEVGIDAEASLKGGACDIEPRKSVVQVPAAVTAPQAQDTQTQEVLADLQSQLRKSNRKARRKAAEARADGFLDGVCGVLQPGDVAIDLGVHAGDVSERLLATGATVIGFDPEPWTAEKVKARLGDHSNYVFHNAAAGLTDGEATLFRSVNFGNNDRNAGKSTLMGDAPGVDLSDGINVQQIDFIKFLKDTIADKGSIAFLKMDIEGGELVLLEKMEQEGLFKDIRCTAVQTHERKFGELRPRYRALRARFEENYRSSHVNLDWR